MERRAGPKPAFRLLRLASTRSAPVAQLDRAPDYESGGQRFESFRARQQRIEVDVVYCASSTPCFHGASWWKQYGSNNAVPENLSACSLSDDPPRGLPS